MNNETVTISAKTAADLDYLCLGDKSGDARTKLIERLLSEEATEEFYFRLMHDNQDQLICQHRRLKLTDNGLYECTTCSAEFEMTIPY